MSDPRQCDRCGTYFDAERERTYVLERYIHIYGKVKCDLCQSCYEKLEQFMKGENVNGKHS